MFTKYDFDVGPCAGGTERAIQQAETIPRRMPHSAMIRVTTCEAWSGLGRRREEPTAASQRLSCDGDTQMNYGGSIRG